VGFLKVCDGFNIQDMFPLAIPRVAGLLAHWIEALDDPDYKIFRSRQVYTGEKACCELQIY
jgi:citrate synthase